MDDYDTVPLDFMQKDNLKDMVKKLEEAFGDEINTQETLDLLTLTLIIAVQAGWYPNDLHETCVKIINTISKEDA